jgi:N-acetyl-alpha-D-muramate 1-phosphate uridylyltransferase
MTAGLVAVVLAAGEGRRLRPLTDLRAKALCPVNNVPLIDRALAAVCRHTPSVAVNCHSHRDQLGEHLDAAAVAIHLSVEEPVALGTAGALGKLRDWIAGRDVLVHNADAYLPAGVDDLVSDWDARHCRLLVTPTPDLADFGRLRYLGACLLPWRLVRRLAPVPSGLYEQLWQDTPDLDLVTTDAVAIDCGTPPRYLRANLHASGGASVIGQGAVVRGELVRSVAWPGARVAPGERLVESIRVGSDLTVEARQQPDW